MVRFYIALSLIFTQQAFCYGRGVAAAGAVAAAETSVLPALTEVQKLIHSFVELTIGKKNSKEALKKLEKSKNPAALNFVKVTQNAIFPRNLGAIDRDAQSRIFAGIALNVGENKFPELALSTKVLLLKYLVPQIHLPASCEHVANTWLGRETTLDEQLNIPFSQFRELVLPLLARAKNPVFFTLWGEYLVKNGHNEEAFQAFEKGDPSHLINASILLINTKVRPDLSHYERYKLAMDYTKKALKKPLPEAELAARKDLSVMGRWFMHRKYYEEAYEAFTASGTTESLVGLALLWKNKHIRPELSDEEHYARAVELLTPLRCSSSLTTLGTMHLKGKVDKDASLEQGFNKAYELHAQAAELDPADSQIWIRFVINVIATRAHDSPENLQRLIDLLAQLPPKQVAPIRGELFLEGKIGLELSYQERLEKAAEQFAQNPDDMKMVCRLAWTIRRGKLGDDPMGTALALFKRAADAGGDNPGLWNLILWYCDEAMFSLFPSHTERYRTIADLCRKLLNDRLAPGRSDALRVLGALHFQGLGVNKNLALALDYLRQAAALGDFRAMEAQVVLENYLQGTGENFIFDLPMDERDGGGATTLPKIPKKKTFKEIPVCAVPSIDLVAARASVCSSESETLESATEREKRKKALKEGRLAAESISATSDETSDSEEELFVEEPSPFARALENESLSEAECAASFGIETASMSYDASSRVTFTKQAQRQLNAMSDGSFSKHRARINHHIGSAAAGDIRAFHLLTADKKGLWSATIIKGHRLVCEFISQGDGSNKVIVHSVRDHYDD